MAKFLGQQYVPKYEKYYFDPPCYDRDLMRYFNHLDYEVMSNNPEFYFKNKEVVNFDLIHHRCRGDPLKNVNRTISLYEK